MRHKVLRVLVLVLLLLSALLTGCAKHAPLDYGVFLGINGEEIDKLKGFSLVVIEPTEFQADQIETLHDAGTKVYGYLNIGAIEEYRPYFERFGNLTLDVYENWEDERWVDVSSPEWQDFIVNELGKQALELGLDGFFLDNADVYYHYQSEEVFQGLVAILKGLKTFRLPLILNGGDFFVSRCLEEGIAARLFDGVNQETVFTSIDFEHHTYGKQEPTETDYFKEYLAKVKAANLSVFLLEYAASPAVLKQIEAYCRQNGFLWYNAKGLELR